MLRLSVSAVVSVMFLTIWAHARAQELRVVCDTAGNRLELVSVRPDRSNTDESFDFVRLPRDRATTVPSFETYDCDFANGRAIRIKAYADPARAWGMCGADPANHLSVWIDQRKYLSGPIYSSCFGAEVVRVFVDAARVETCRLGGRDEQWMVSGVPTVDCREESISALPIDRREYPLPSDNWPAPGTVLRTIALDKPLCARFADPPDESFSPFLYRRPLWHTLQEKFPTSFEWSEFDFDNDGRIDLVIRIRHADSMSAGDNYFVFQPDDEAALAFIEQRPIDDHRTWVFLETRARAFLWGFELWREDKRLSQQPFGVIDELRLRKHLEAAATRFRSKFENYRRLVRKSPRQFDMQALLRERLHLLDYRLDYHFFEPYTINGRTVLLASRPYWEEPGWAVVAVDQDLQPKLICEFQVVPENR